MARMPYVLAFVAFCSLANAQGMLIDDFEQGDFTRTLTGVSGQASANVLGIDPGHTVGGARKYDFIWGNNVRGQTITYANREGSNGVSWPEGGEPNILTELRIGWGNTEFHSILLDLSWFTSFEVARHTLPGFINASRFQISVRDANGRDDRNSAWRQRPDEDIGFNRIDFRNPDFDWSRVTNIDFTQDYNFTQTQLHGHFLDEIRVVPEPCSLLAGGVGLLLARRKSRANLRYPRICTRQEIP